MKHKLLYGLLCLSIVLSSCEDIEPKIGNLTLSTQNLYTGPNGGTLTFSITCNSQWQISGLPSWCTANPTSGQNNAKISLNISASEEDRQATLTVTSGTKQATLTLYQNSSLENFHYELPVIFHVLREPSDREKIRNGWLEQVINDCNAQYMGLLGDSPDMRVSFVLAETRPDGTPLSEPGVEYIEWSTSTIDPDVFMDDQAPDKKAVALLWDLNSYINVFVYHFTDEKSDVMGISFMPYTPKQNALEGLYEGDIYWYSTPSYVHCVSINRDYLYDRSTSTIFYPTDIVNTLSHELGHYLGLLHSFSEERCGGNDDYCDDTPDYNRAEYVTWLEEFLSTSQDYTMEDLSVRNACDGTTFVAHNIMDYNYSYVDQFTEDQAQRIRHVLTYSPLIPGPKYNQPLGKAPQDLEIPPAVKMP